MGTLGIAEILALAFLALVIFGPERLPAIMKDAGKFVAYLKNLSQQALTDFQEASGLNDETIKEVKDVGEKIYSFSSPKRAGLSIVSAADRTREKENSHLEIPKKSLSQNKAQPGFAPFDPEAP